MYFFYAPISALISCTGIMFFVFFLSFEVETHTKSVLFNAKLQLVIILTSHSSERNKTLGVIVKILSS